MSPKSIITCIYYKSQCLWQSKSLVRQLSKVTKKYEEIQDILTSFLGENVESQRAFLCYFIILLIKKSLHYFLHFYTKYAYLIKNKATVLLFMCNYYYIFYTNYMFYVF